MGRIDAKLGLSWVVPPEALPSGPSEAHRLVHSGSAPGYPSGSHRLPRRRARCLPVDALLAQQEDRWEDDSDAACCSEPGLSLLKAVFDYFDSSPKLLYSLFLWAKKKLAFRPSAELFGFMVNVSVNRQCRLASGSWRKEEEDDDELSRYSQSG
ncbi:hypothetical protein PanWU01x14_296530 [Parasponia andersonii]|uniref:Uncharacterized protein n=1 Tax=Parasponia andersonii TaxID=3476 RepID=A0A2P5AVD3_PARAD|nr:hypothetical protein PanWU01x14_296530 [Parasponia andersonii]